MYIGDYLQTTTIIIIAQEIGHLPEDTAKHLITEYEHVSLMLAKLIQARSMKK